MIKDHINFAGLAGRNPLCGENDVRSVVNIIQTGWPDKNTAEALQLGSNRMLLQFMWTHSISPRFNYSNWNQ